ncbi:SRPBCC domain-containing protein [candidate division KSB1 bacterium]|nr:MAG: SRPBCC domain-containing protein [candidate division KSB1 bacterium]MCE7943633.1 SRPBCC domain-containing protein [Chlorobi bacterium CHB1]MDL1875223.1 SRPBCC domain-containing protein [Cytophagia bacterium CHB2]
MNDFLSLAILPFTWLIAAFAQEPAVERAVVVEVVVNASPDKVWLAWTTEEGVTSFFAPACKLDLRVLGVYEMYFAPHAAPGLRGGEGNMILAIQPEKMLSFTWNAPPHLPNVRQQRTSVVVRLKEINNNQTRVTLTEIGWGENEEWDQAYQYFSAAWKYVLGNLKRRFAEGPIDWQKELAARQAAASQK